MRLKYRNWYNVIIMRYKSLTEYTKWWNYVDMRNFEKVIIMRWEENDKIADLQSHWYDILIPIFTLIILPYEFNLIISTFFRF